MALTPSEAKIAFNKNSDLLFGKLKEIITKNKTMFDMGVSMFSILKMSGSHIDTFYSNVDPFTKQIWTKDEKFFLEKQNINGVENFPFTLGLTEDWKGFSDKDKDILWEFFSVLHCLAYLSLEKGTIQEYSALMTL